MRELLKDILEIKGVNGVFIISDQGETLFKEVTANSSAKIEDVDFNIFIESVRGYREIELLYENGRIYIRKFEFGFVIVVVDLHVQIAIIRLNCDIILPALHGLKTNKKYKKLFKK